MKSLLLGFFVVLVSVLVLGSGYLWATAASVAALPELKDGDVVFHSSRSTQSTAIWMASGSLYTHMGMIKHRDGMPYVVEAVGPVREISLEDWIAEGLGGRLSVMRFKNLTNEDAGKVLNAAEAYMGLPYDPYFTFGKDRIYCSELVYYAFKEGLSEDLGKVQKIKDLNLDNRAVKALIAERWEGYPPCQKAEVGSLEQCLPILYEEELITPVSISEDSRLEPVYSNY